MVVDIGLASQSLAAVLAKLNYKNLDEIDEFSGANTTTEFLAKHIFDQMITEIHQGNLGPSAKDLHSLKVTLHESHLAWGAYEGNVSQ